MPTLTLPIQLYSETKMTFSLFVEITFKSENELNIFTDKFTFLAEWIEENEADTTTSYKLLQSDKDPLTVLVLERYINKEAYTDIHKASQEFRDFRALLSTLDPIITGHSYNDSEIGYLHS
jgi:quinol monooxygenase YgiN